MNDNGYGKLQDILRNRLFINATTCLQVNSTNITVNNNFLMARETVLSAEFSIFNSQKIDREDYILIKVKDLIKIPE